MQDNQLATIKQEADVIEYAAERKQLQQIIKKIFKENVDYGVIPGTSKKSLFQPGAEKIAKVFGLTPNYELMKEVEDFEKGFFYYKYKCTLTHFATGKFVGAAERSCNSMEKKYLSYTKAEKWATEDEKKRVIGKKKNEKYNSWDLVIRKSPEEAADQANTIQAMAQKRAYVAVVRAATSASEIFDEDDTDVKDVAPQAVKSPEDELRENEMKRLHVTGQERGFSHDKLSAGAKKRYKVKSLSECTAEQLTAMIDELEMEWEPVPAGQKPIKIGVANAAEILDGEVIEDTLPCRECQTPGAPTDGDHAYFCDDDCKTQYWKKHPQKSDKKEINGYTFTNQK